ncbi:MAG TPA: hypothetical protein ENK26_03645 [Gammaproteobacteria bacterium]|nr:hypothetical protein [Gammaproteobacteria bacterium]
MSRSSRRNGGWRKLLPLLIFAAFALFIAREQFPAVNDGIESLLHPLAFQAVKACRERALSGAENPQFARLIRYGEANPTQAGWFVDDIVVGEMRPGEGEQRVLATCHVDDSGKVVNVFRQPYGAGSPMAREHVEGEPD